MSFMNLKKTYDKYIVNTYDPKICFVKGKGCFLYDNNGKEYIDLGSGIGVNIFGHFDQKLIKDVNVQMNKIIHSSNLYYTEPQIKLAKILCKKTNMKKVFFSNSGAEANECAIKVAKKYSIDKYGEKRNKIITLINSFHGRTITTLSATGQDVFHKHFNPFNNSFIYADLNFNSIKNIISKDKNICAVMVEVIQGESGVNVLKKKFLEDLYSYVNKKDILFICDEVQTGNGRTGKMYSYMNYNIYPDIVSTAKGLGGGFPIGATLFNSKTCDVLTKGTHGSTFGGNPLCCAAAVSIVSRINDSLLKKVKEKGDYIIKELKKLKNVKSVDGIGLMIGIKPKKNLEDIINKCLENGILVLKAKDKIRLLPPLNIEVKYIKKAINILKKCIEE